MDINDKFDPPLQIAVNDSMPNTTFATPGELASWIAEEGAFWDKLKADAENAWRQDRSFNLPFSQVVRLVNQFRSKVQQLLSQNAPTEAFRDALMEFSNNFILQRIFSVRSRYAHAIQDMAKKTQALRCALRFLSATLNLIRPARAIFPLGEERPLLQKYLKKV